MKSIKIWLQLMFILALILAATLLSFILVPVLVLVGFTYLAWLLPKKAKEIEDFENNKKPSYLYTQLEEIKKDSYTNQE